MWGCEYVIVENNIIAFKKGSGVVIYVIKNVYVIVICYVNVYVIKNLFYIKEELFNQLMPTMVY